MICGEKMPLFECFTGTLIFIFLDDKMFQSQSHSDNNADYKGIFATKNRSDLWPCSGGFLKNSISILERRGSFIPLIFLTSKSAICYLNTINFILVEIPQHFFGGIFQFNPPSGVNPWFLFLTPSLQDILYVQCTPL